MSSRACGARLGRGVKVGHAGTLDPFATGLLLVLVGRATRVQRFLMALPKTLRDRRAARRRLDHRRPRRRDRGPGRAGGPLSCRRACCASGRRPTARSRSAGGAPTRARRGEAVELARARRHRLRASSSSGARRTARGSDRVLVGHVRALPDGRPRGRLQPGAAADAIGQFDVGTPTRTGHPARRRARASCRRGALERRGRAPGRPRRGGARRGGRASVRLVDADGLIALAEPREDGMLKPAVGFRG